MSTEIPFATSSDTRDPDGPVDRLARLGRCLADTRAIKIVALLRAVGQADEMELRHALILSFYQIRPALAKLLDADVIAAHGAPTSSYALQPGASTFLGELLLRVGAEEEWVREMEQAVRRLGEFRSRPRERSSKLRDAV